MAPKAAAGRTPPPPAGMPAPGDPAPPLDLPAHDGSRVRLAGLRGRSVVVFFVPRAATPG